MRTPCTAPYALARLAVGCLLLVVAAVPGASAQGPRVAIIGGGIGGTAAAYFLRQQQPTWHIDLFERAPRLGGRTQEFVLENKTYELGASIIHGVNKHVLDLAAAMNLTVKPGDDTGGAFSIWDGTRFVFSQVGEAVTDFLAVAKRYGVTPLRYKWLASSMADKFGRIYALQQQGQAFATPQAWLSALGLYNTTQQSAADYMMASLGRGLWRYGTAAFVEELAGAINRINYNQRNEDLNALAGLVSYLPAADPRVFSIQEGNAELPRRLAQAARLQGLHLGEAVQGVHMDTAAGQYVLTGAASQQRRQQQDDDDDVDTTPLSGGLGALRRRQPRGRRQPEAARTARRHTSSSSNIPPAYGPYDAVIIAAPVEGSGLQLTGLRPQPRLPPRSYRATVTTFVTGFLDAAFFGAASIPDGDVFVTSGAATPFSVIASKGTVSAAAARAAAAALQQGGQGSSGCGSGSSGGDGGSISPEVAAAGAAGAGAAGGQEGDQEQGQQQPEGGSPDAVLHDAQQQQQLPLWKVFSEAPLSWQLLRTLFVNGSVVITKAWAAYPEFSPPEDFAPFQLSPTLCYVNALENAASAMEVAALAAKNCALLIQQELVGRGGGLSRPGGDSAGAGMAAA